MGTIWIDDVSVTELGPRLRPIKATKLLVTNVLDYVPRGLDGRDAYPLPRAPLIAVEGLQETARTESNMTLEWNTGRLKRGGYNVYLNAGSDCPTTKYFQYTSLWGKTTVTINNLHPTTSYTVKVTAINEDGLEGRAATIEVGTTRPPL